MGFTMHHTRLITNGNNFVGRTIYGHYRRTVHHNLVIVNDEGIGGS